MTSVVEDGVPPPIGRAHRRLAEMCRAIRADDCHRQGWNARGVRCAMIDTGFGAHPYLERIGARIERLTADGEVDRAADESGHGTGNSAIFATVAPGAELLGIRLPKSGVARTLELALDRGARVIIGCWGWNYEARSLDELRVKDPVLFFELAAVEEVVARGSKAGAHFVFAAGNGGQIFPGALPEVIAAGGVTIDAEGRKSPSTATSRFISTLYPGREVPDACGVAGSGGLDPAGHLLLPVPRGSALDGKNLPVSALGKGWGIFSGSSAAAAQVGAALAILLQLDSALSPEQGKSILRDTSGEAGLIDVAAACRAVARRKERG